MENKTTNLTCDDILKSLMQLLNTELQILEQLNNNLLLLAERDNYKQLALYTWIKYNGHLPAKHYRESADILSDEVGWVVDYGSFRCAWYKLRKRVECKD